MPSDATTDHTTTDHTTTTPDHTITPDRRPGLKRPDRLAANYGPWAVVTGASDGIGRASAELLAAAGVNLVLTARRQHRLDDLASTLAARHRIGTRVVPADLSSPDGLDRLFAATEGLEVGLLVAAAGYATTGPFLDNSAEGEADLVDVNCRAVVATTHHYGRLMAGRGRGGIVLFSSIVAFQGVSNTATYAATKAFIQSLAEGIGPELEAVGIDLVVSAPGPVASGFADRADMRMGSAADPHDVARATLNALGRRSTVRPGARSKVLGYSLATAPRRLRSWILTRIIGGFTAHQTDPAR